MRQFLIPTLARLPRVQPVDDRPRNHPDRLRTLSPTEAHLALNPHLFPAGAVYASPDCTFSAGRVR